MPEICCRWGDETFALTGEYVETQLFSSSVTSLFSERLACVLWRLYCSHIEYQANPMPAKMPSSPVQVWPVYRIKPHAKSPPTTAPDNMVLPAWLLGTEVDVFIMAARWLADCLRLV